MGEGYNEHGRALDAAQERNITRCFHTFTRRQAATKDLKLDLSLTFRELYHTEQMRMGHPGPISLFPTASILLFIKSCSDRRTRKWANFTALLQSSHKGLDYCYHLADLCSLLPTYQQNVRALTTVKDLLAEYHLKL